MLKKVEKEFDNIYGIKKYDENCFLDIPCLLTSFPGPLSARELNGTLSQMLYLLQIRSSKVDSDYTISDVQADFVTCENDDNFHEIIENKIPKNNKEQAKKIMRNLNIFSFCNGHQYVASTLYKIHDKLLEYGYKEEDALEILSSVFVLQVVDNYVENNQIKPIPYATTVVIQDIFDIENLQHIRDLIKSNKRIEFTDIKKYNNTTYMLYRSFGEGTLSKERREHGFRDDYLHAPILSSIMSLYLIKALESSIKGNSIQDISINDELEQVELSARGYIDNTEKNSNDLSKGELNKLNNMLLFSVRDIFKSHIQVRKLNDSEREYLNKKDVIVKQIYELNSNFFTTYDECFETINKMINLYENYSYGQVMSERSGNFLNLNFTREEKLISLLELLSQNLELFNQQIDKVIYPEDLSDEMKLDFNRFLGSCLEKIKERVNSIDFQKVISDLNLSYKNDVISKII